MSSDKKRLLEEYTVGETLGEGAFGIVYACRRRTTGEEVAVKMVDKVETPVASIKEEVDMLASLDHPNIVKLHQVFYERCFVCIVMDKYKGGDLVEGMQKHWKEKGKIPCQQSLHVCKQMAHSISYLHQQQIVHRDIKGDNYLMNRKDIENPATIIVLSDFGTAVRLKTGERCHSGVGTKIFWSPEFFDRDYGLAVDIWAMGVIMYGLLDGRFPFRDENDVRNKTLRFPKGTLPSCEDFVRKMLTKEEAKRIVAQDLVQHAWISSPENADQGAAAMGPDDGGSTWSPEGLREGGANEGMRERRRELVERLEDADKAKRDKKVDGKSGEKKLEHYWAEWFTIVDKHAANSTLKFEWWSQDKVEKEGILVMEGAKPVSDDSDKTSSSVVGQQLTEHGVDINAFGKKTDKGQAKTLDQLAKEVQSGAARLMLDATSHKKLVRVVDVVLLRIRPLNDKEGRCLIEKAEKFPDGRDRSLLRPPGTKKEPHENTKKVAERILKDMLNMADCNVVFDFKAKEVFEEEMESPSFPGVTTVYRKEIVEGKVKTTDPAVLKRIGLPTGDEWSFEDSTKNTKFLSWFTDKQCLSNNIKIRAPESAGEVSGLVQAPIGLNEEDLTKYLQGCNIDVTKFGQAGAKSIRDISSELIKGESSLSQDPNGEVLRVVDLVVVKLVNSMTQGILVQTDQTLPDGKKIPLKRLPGAKRRPDENQFLTARRILRKQLRMDEDVVNIIASDVRMVEEEKASPGYPGLRTVYRKRIVPAELMRN